MVIAGESICSIGIITMEETTPIQILIRIMEGRHMAIKREVRIKNNVTTQQRNHAKHQKNKSSPQIHRLNYIIF